MRPNGAGMTVDGKRPSGRLKFLFIRRIIRSVASFLSGRDCERRLGLGAGGGSVSGSKNVEKQVVFNDFGDFEGSRSEVVLGGSWEASWGLSGGSRGRLGSLLGPS